MRRIATYALGGVLLCAGTAAWATNAVSVDKNLISKGQTITLSLNFSANKVIVSGGRFKTGVEVTGHRTITDHPAVSTHYVFNVYYTAKITKPDDGTPKKEPEHIQYSVDVNVLNGPVPKLATYADPHGWQINHLSGWRHDNVWYPDEGSDALTYFQPDLDALERIAISIMPVKDKTCQEILDQNRADMPSHYAKLEFQPDTPLEFESVPALWTTYTGMDMAHPGEHIQAMILTFVKNGRAYTISARTNVSQFKKRGPILESLMKSFTLQNKAARKTASTGN